MTLEFGHNHLVVSLRCMAGEFRAIEALAADVRESFTPLWEVRPDADDDGDQDAMAPLDDAIDKLPKRINDSANGLPGFIDTSLLLPGRRRSDGAHPLEWICARAADLGLLLVPVVGTNSDADHIAAARNVDAAAGSGCAIRLGSGELRDTASVDRLARGLAPGLERLHLILDCEYISDERVAALLETALLGTANAIINLTRWLTITLLGGSFPPDMSGQGTGVITFPRREWALWQTLVQPGALVRRPSYGDYGIQHPIFRLVPYVGNAAIRYTDDTDFLIFRGNRLFERYGGYAQFYELAQTCTLHPSYRGAPYSDGDSFIKNVADRTKGPGNPTTWRYVGTNQHVTYVARTVHAVP